MMSLTYTVAEARNKLPDLIKLRDVPVVEIVRKVEQGRPQEDLNAWLAVEGLVVFKPCPRGFDALADDLLLISCDKQLRKYKGLKLIW